MIRILFQVVEGSGAPLKTNPGVPSDLEVQGSGAGYSSDDEDGDDVHGSGGLVFLTSCNYF